MVDDEVTAVAALLEALAEHTGPPVSVSELCRRAGLSGPTVETAAPMVLALLSAFGVLRSEHEPTNGQAGVVAVSPQACYFLHSLASYVRTGRSILANWERPGTTEPPYTSRQALSGPQFLYLVEERRLALDSDAAPLRRTEVVQVVVKCRLRGRGGRAQYLLVYDDRARQYQLPGGHIRASDADARAAAARELEEELLGYDHTPGREELKELGAVSAVQLSRTFGAVTEYRVVFFQLESKARSIPVGPGGRWVPEDALLDQATLLDGTTLNVTALDRLDQSLPGGLRGLPWSLPDVQRRSLRAVVRDRPWETVGLVIGILGLILSVAPLLG
ncbi:NUDIX domain-containing protein [Streptomyces sp. NPDC058914]|uniref:NUDIX domain-containing protein n=1 Tax=Streptomyces sp. NPDC058914 TaxID=3346671 RepID=UPI0036C4FF7E